MLLAYEYRDLLSQPAHEGEVAAILRALDGDFITQESHAERDRLLARLRELGETGILSRLGEGPTEA